MLSANEVPLMVSNYYELPIDNMLSKCKKEIYVHPRHMLIYLLRYQFTLTEREIGELSNSSRGAVQNAVRRIFWEATYSVDTMNELSTLTKYINNPYLFKPKVYDDSRPQRIYQYTKDMVLVRSFDSIKDASSVTDISAGTIGRAIRSYKYLGRGFYWIRR